MGVIINKNNQKYNLEYGFAVQNGLQYPISKIIRCFNGAKEVLWESSDIIKVSPEEFSSSIFPEKSEDFGRYDITGVDANSSVCFYLSDSDEYRATISLDPKVICQNNIYKWNVTNVSLLENQLIETRLDRNNFLYKKKDGIAPLFNDILRYDESINRYMRTTGSLVMTKDFISGAKRIMLILFKQKPTESVKIVETEDGFECQAYYDINKYDRFVVYPSESDVFDYSDMIRFCLPCGSVSLCAIADYGDSIGVLSGNITLQRAHSTTMKTKNSRTIYRALKDIPAEKTYFSKPIKKGSYLYVGSNKLYTEIGLPINN